MHEIHPVHVHIALLTYIPGSNANKKLPLLLFKLGEVLKVNQLAVELQSIAPS